jgi:hypothetical protein
MVSTLARPSISAENFPAEISAPPLSAASAPAVRGVSTETCA